MAGATQAGATAGAAFGPWGAAAGAVMGGVVDVMSAPKPAAPSSADSVFGTSLSFDNGGWNIAFDGARIDAPVDKTTEQGGPSGPSYGNFDSMQGYMPYLLAAFGMVVAWKIFKKS